MPKKTAAGIYCRISLDAEGDGGGVARQEQDCRDLAARLGLNVVDVYIDNDTGASTHSRKKVRPEYNRLIADAEAGRIGVILAYSNSRVTRRLRELEDLIALHDKHGTRIVTVVSGQDDLSTADGRMIARIKASVDTAESDKVSERVKRKHLELARAGKVVGGGNRPFGWEKDQVTIREAEAALIREAAKDVLDGVTVGNIVTRWNAAGVTTTTGRAWTGGTVLQLLRSPRLAGWRVHRPKGTPWQAIPPIAVDRAGEPVVGEWEPIITDAQHRALAALLTRDDNRKRVPRRNARHYLLTGILKCGICNSSMYGNKVNDHHYYRCDTPGHSNSCSGGGADGWVAEQVIFASEHVIGVPTGEATEEQERLVGLNRHIAEIDEAIEELMAAMRDRKVSARVTVGSVSMLEETRNGLVRERDLAEAASLASRPQTVDRATWEAMDVDARRAVVEKFLDVVYLSAAPVRRRNTFDTSRMNAAWKTMPTV